MRVTRDQLAFLRAEEKLELDGQRFNTAGAQVQFLAGQRGFQAGDNLQAQTGASGAARTQVSARERAQRVGQTGAAVWLRGTTPARAREVAFALERRLYDLGHAAYVLAIGMRAFQFTDARSLTDELQREGLL